jgi:3',5'-cyclic AMP phosphodiesterase CpdA
MLRTRLTHPLCWLVSLIGLALACDDERSPTHSLSDDDAIAYREPTASDRWTLVVLPDTQDYAAVAPELLHAQVDWILRERDALDIRMVVHVGDIVDEDVPEQWDAAEAALSKLAGQVPFLFLPGNHDFEGKTERRRSMLDRHFAPRDYFAGNEGGTYDASGWNSYQIVKSPSRDWLFIGLEFAPRADVLAWAEDVMEQHAELDTVFATHAYLYFDGQRYDYPRYGDTQRWNPFTYSFDPADKHDGEQIWQRSLRAKLGALR